MKNLKIDIETEQKHIVLHIEDSDACAKAVGGKIDLEATVDQALSQFDDAHAVEVTADTAKDHLVGA